MKKILVLVAMFALLATSVFAQVELNGFVDMRYINDFDDDTVSEVDGGETVPADPFTYAEARTSVAATIDDYNTVEMRLRMRPFTSDYADAFQVDRAFATTDIGAYAGLDAAGLGLVMQNGLQEFANPDVNKITVFELEDILNHKFTAWGSGVVFNVLDMVNVRSAWVYPTYSGDNADAEFRQFYIGADAVVGPVSFEIGYSNPEEAVELGEGEFGVGAAVTVPGMPQDLDLTASAAFLYDVESADTDPDWTYSAALTAGYMGLVNGGVAVLGQEESEFDAMSFEVGVTPIEGLGLDAGFLFNFDDENTDRGEDVFTGADISASYALGGATFRLGYLLVTEGNTFFNDFRLADVSDAAFANGGLYFTTKVEF